MGEREPIQWLAVYRDGSALPQYDGDKENRYTGIDRARLAAMTLTRDGVPVLSVFLDHPEQRLVFRRRNFIHPGGEKQTFYLVGWVSGDNRQIAAVGEDGTVSLFSKWRDDHWLFGPIELLPCEESG